MKNQILKQLSKVIDPELGIDIVSLGLIYKVEEKNGQVKIIMTLTSPGCPLADVIDGEVRGKVGKIKGVKNIRLDITFEPLWTVDKMSEEARARFGM